MRRPLFFLAALVVTTLPQPASAYVREVTKSGVPVAWKRPCVTLKIFVGDPPSMLASDQYAAAATEAAAVWSYPQLGCTDIRLSISSESAASAGAGYDKQNVIVFRRARWCREPDPINDAGIAEPDCYPPSALAVTTVVKNSNTGEILDTDIEFNAVDYSWGDLVAHPETAAGRTADFQNALTHELGHVIGLDHNCFAPSDGQARLNDNTGAPEVDCYNNPKLPASVSQATMYPSVVLSDTQRRVLSPDDENGACEIYPHANDSCPTDVGGGGCDVNPAGSEQTSGTLIAVGASVATAIALVWRRRRVLKTETAGL